MKVLDVKNDEVLFAAVECLNSIPVRFIYKETVAHLVAVLRRLPYPHTGLTDPLFLPSRSNSPFQGLINGNKRFKEFSSNISMLHRRRDALGLRDLILLAVVLLVLIVSSGMTSLVLQTIVNLLVRLASSDLPQAAEVLWGHEAETTILAVLEVIYRNLSTARWPAR